MTGFGTAAARGLPDIGLLTMTEMVQNVRWLAESVEVPVICDADTGYGNALNVGRTVREYEKAGAAALHLEDQVWPKRCGFLEGKQVIPEAEMVPKVRAACDARSDTDFVIIARTDALQPEGWDSAEHRARAYREAGADLVDLPCLYNGLLLPVSEIESLGFRLMIHPGTLAAGFQAMRDAMATLKDAGDLPEARDPRVFAEVIGLLGVREAFETGKRYEDS